MKYYEPKRYLDSSPAAFIQVRVEEVLGWVGLTAADAGLPALTTRFVEEENDDGSLTYWELPTDDWLIQAVRVIDRYTKSDLRRELPPHLFLPPERN